MRCAILQLEANLETFPVWFISGGRLPQPRGVFSTVLLKSVAVCLYATGEGAPPTCGRIICMQGYRVNVKISLEGAQCPGVLPPIHLLCNFYKTRQYIFNRTDWLVYRMLFGLPSQGCLK